MLHLLRLFADAFMFVVLAIVALAWLVSFGYVVRKVITKGFRAAL